jgi:hypothetical protein
MGDVIPFVNLGVGFRQRGHNVIIAANARFQSFIEEKGFTFREINVCDQVYSLNLIYLFNYLILRHLTVGYATRMGKY